MARLTRDVLYKTYGDFFPMTYRVYIYVAKYCKLLYVVQHNTLLTRANNLLSMNGSKTEQSWHIAAQMK
jgi:hypothetical protein